MSDSEFCIRCRHYRTHHINNIGACEGPGSNFICEKKCQRYLMDDRNVFYKEGQ